MADYTAAPWEPLDAPARMWGVFPTHGYSAGPVAILATKELAHGFIDWQRSLGDDAHRHADLCVCAVDGLTAHVWNDIDPPVRP